MGQSLDSRLANFHAEAAPPELRTLPASVLSARHPSNLAHVPHVQCERIEAMLHLTSSCEAAGAARRRFVFAKTLDVARYAVVHGSGI